MGSGGRREDQEALMPQSSVVGGRKKVHLVLDLDHTLVHCVPVSKLTLQEYSASMQKKTMMISRNPTAAGDTHLLDGGALVLKFRPGVRSFLEEASAMFDLSIYTMGTRHYANQVAARLVRHASRGGGGLLSFVKVISREDCTVAKQKGLDVVPSHRRAVLVVDDKPKVWAREDRDNVVTISPYYFFGLNKGGKDEEEEEDKGELSRVLGVLKEVHSRFFHQLEEGEGGERDVAQILKRVRLFMLYHGPPDVSSLLHHHGRRRRRRHQEEEEKEEGGRGEDWSRIKRIKIVFRSGTCGVASPPPIATTATIL
ncbi:unnamed protein product [Cuscuta campestris]|uniref:protein-serine/threonine phosphatase n=1 Tax=Cuscuta campestris TaxID=132261 RepID=A0A484LZW9_9ASTE|nr:unnamed protein product [Cuscuta campestris]